LYAQAGKMKGVLNELIVLLSRNANEAGAAGNRLSSADELFGHEDSTPLMLKTPGEDARDW
jgi:hypothetical protein